MKIVIGIMLIVFSSIFTIVIAMLADSKDEIWNNIKFEEKENKYDKK